MNNLEEIDFNSVRNKDNLTYAEWRLSLKPIYARVWTDIVLYYLGIILTATISGLLNIHYPSLFILNAFFCSILLGLALASLSLFIHEAGHFNIHPDKKRNDQLAAVFLCSIFGLDIKSYRKIHWQHHLHLGTPSDTETSYFNALTPVFLLESFTGIHLLRTISKRNSNTFLSQDMKRASFRMLVRSALINLAILCACIFFKQWPLAIAWVAAMFIFFPFFATLRQVLEHRDELADRTLNYNNHYHGKIARLFSSDLLSRVFGAAGFNKHMIHHWDPQMSYTRIKDIEHFLQQCDATKDVLANSATTYSKTLKKLLFR